MPKLNSKTIETEVEDSSLIAEKIVEVRRKINSLLKKLDDDRANTSKLLLSGKNNSEPQSNLSEITNDNASEQNTEVIQSNTQGNINTHVY